VIIGLALACLCAIVTNVGFLLKHRGAVAAPPVDARHPLRSAADLFRSRWWTIGWSVAFVAFAIHAAALALAPLSVVQAVVAGGLVFLAVLAERSFGFKLGRREWAGVAVAAAGLAFLGLTQRRGVADLHTYSLAGLIALRAPCSQSAGSSSRPRSGAIRCGNGRGSSSDSQPGRSSASRM
jgi:drug/metabolite transporter (DMT)-like permease